MKNQTKNSLINTGSRHRTGWTKLIQNERKHHNIKVSILLKYFNTLHMMCSHSKSEKVKLLGQNLQLISSFESAITRREHFVNIYIFNGRFWLQLIDISDLYVKIYLQFNLYTYKICNKIGKHL
jgi:hypothetical protein